MHGLLRSPPIILIRVYLGTNVGPWGATHRSASPVLRHSESGPLGLSVCECRAAGSASGQTACPLCPTLHQSQPHHGDMSPLSPGCLSLPLLPVWMNVSFFICLASDFLAIRFSVSSGCARRRSVSTYASILVLSQSEFIRFSWQH